MPTDAPDGNINAYVVRGPAKGRKAKAAADVTTADTHAHVDLVAEEAVNGRRDETVPPTKPVPSKVTKASKK